MMRKIFKNIAMICLALCVAVGSFFVPIRKLNQSQIASADNTRTDLTFNGSNIWVPVSRTTELSTYYVDYLLVNINFSINYLTNSFVFNFDGTTGFYTSNQWSWGGSNYNYFPFEGLYPETGTTIDLRLIFNRDLTNPYVAYFYGNDDTSKLGYLMFTIVGSENIIDSDIVSVSLGYVNSVNSNNNYEANFVKYTDVNGNYVTFYFRTLTGRANANQLDSRTYYFPNAFDLSDSQIYQQGYNQGLADNQQNIYVDGYNTGYDVGFDRGVINGVAESNNYSFLGLIGAVVDAPVSILSSLFNFTFLGINLWSFITSLLTIALILFVVKIFMRR